MRVRVASAGTGKTASLVQRYVEQVASGTPPRRIAGVTFTRKAADELRVRVEQALEEVLRTGAYLGRAFADAPAQARFLEAQLELSGAPLFTIHGFMAHCLRMAAPMMGLDPDFSLLSDWEARGMFEEEWNALRYLAADPAHPLHTLAQESLTEPLLHLFGKRSLAERFEAAEGPANQALLEVYTAVSAAYEARLGARLLSPAELERRALELTQRPQALERVLERVQILLIDEYQDVNPLQGRFFEALEAGGLEIEVVGDPKQSIYAFRNADVSVFRKALREGEPLEPLSRSYRHSTTLVRFLNRLTATLAQQGLGFSPEEAPEIQGRREERGRLELHWISGEAPLDTLREQEAWVLAQRLQALQGPLDYSQMAVLVRSYASVPFLERAFRQAGIPYVLLQGRGYYERQEVRDLYHALRAALEGRGLSLAAWLRGPFGQVEDSAQASRLRGLEPQELERILEAEHPLQTLAASFPQIQARLSQIQAKLRTAAPLELLQFLVRAPLIANRCYSDFLEPRARENVDALLFLFASHPPQSLETLLEQLERLSEQAEAGDVPQSGEGVQILTVHRAKGLEWPLVAVFDLGRKPSHPTQPLYLGEPTPAALPLLCSPLALPDTPSYASFKAQVEAKEEEETYRLLYVAVSRARNTLVLSGSVRQGRPEGWAAVLEAMGLGSTGQPFDRPDYLHRTWPYAPPPPLLPEAVSLAAEASEWAHVRFKPEPFPPVFSPSALKRMEAEPLPLPDPEEGEEIPGRARAIGTLVHYAIGQNWDPECPEHLHNLEAQEVMFPFDPDERSSIMAEVRALLQGYRTLLGNELVWPRDEDYPEFAVALPLGSTVWQGVMDRLYRVGERWYLEDYKTDTEVQPERYHFQLAVYLEAVRRAWGINPEVRLVYLRPGQVVALDRASLEAALQEVGPKDPA
ncbi:MAG: UvrD-helicase domain-containing protein [Thermaceae bacterium]|nr:UvrD-helicase domain-containing protein [Thermaceae bacterium]